MSTPFPTLLPPPGRSILSHPLDGSIPTDPSIPPAFTEALSVRIAVFVQEQHCSLEAEIDSDDPKSWHWIVYASVSNPSASSPDPATTARSTSQRRETAEQHSHHDPMQSVEADRQDEAASVARRPSGMKLPIATIRLVPPPHAPHPKPGSVDGVGGAWPASSSHASSAMDHARNGHMARDRVTSLHDGRESYVKLGRLATLKEYRGLGLGRRMVTATLDWASRNAEAIRAAGRGADWESGRARKGSVEGEGVAREREREMGKGEEEEWRGLVLVHAQKGVEHFYRLLGFEKDEELGEWVEEGMDHLAMWKRVDLIEGGQIGI